MRRLSLCLFALVGILALSVSAALLPAAAQTAPAASTYYVNAIYRYRNHPDYGFVYVGFRCARSQ